MPLSPFLRACSSSWFSNLLKLEAKVASSTFKTSCQPLSAEGQNSMTFSKSPGLTCVWLWQGWDEAFSQSEENLQHFISGWGYLTPNIAHATQASDELRRQAIYWLTRICLQYNIVALQGHATLQHCFTQAGSQENDCTSPFLQVDQGVRLSWISDMPHSILRLPHIEKQRHMAKT